jgi:type IV pilus assembly protein PilB
MDDPSDDVARAAVAEYSGLPVRAMIAPPSEIRAAIAAYYVAGSQPPRIATLPPLRPTVTEPNAATVRAPSPPPAAPELGGAGDDADSLPDTVVSGAPVPSRPSGAARQGIEGAETVAEVPPAEALDADASTPSDDDTDVSPRRPEIPAPRRGAGARMVTLTLLDGTQITLPAGLGSSEDGDQAIGDQLTARDLVEALRASLHGADATEILGDSPRWERLVAALLSVLLKKHLVADWEFVDEYSKLG